ncbi:hypothetical protein [Hymenobacter psychrotolerans]|uniref:Dolichyl-phosphate-mannose-protein mannosyltransferase n=1 Tax=Hymenobacter psychrotolerans DSM 18569 TaxID=1121959 RepID=A0A1M6T151_9BACT|nr:hypothetical protein [Hymenobacter psychrotolerans]SHK50620.1 hypothetical protein SAMN02746009_01044 [Hymenobacter psychrotolerans DSM 18569]
MSGKLFRRVLLPALLLLAVGYGLGGYFETNDDAAIILLLRGTAAAAPVTNLHLYFHGLSAVLAWLYEAAPAWPWYALLLYGLLYVATAGAFTVLDRLLTPRLPAGLGTALLVLFFLTAWLEHGFWFNYVRVAILLAGVGVLLAAQRPASRLALVLGLLAFGVGWLIRPSAAVLGLLAVVPGAWWLSGRRSLPALAGAAGLALLGAALLSGTRSPQSAAYRQLDVLKSNLNDYQLYRPLPRTAADSLGIAAVQNWLLSDSTLTNEALFQRAGTLHLPFFLQHTAPAKLAQVLRQLPRDYFPVLLLQGALLVLAAGQGHHRSFWLVQFAYIVALLALGAVLKLPPRLALPLLNCWALSSLVYVFRADGVPDARRAALVVLAVLVVAAVPYMLKTLHRRQVLLAEQQTNNRLRREQAQSAGLLVTDFLPYKSANAFHNPDSQPARMLLLAGWTSADPSQTRWRQALTGTRFFPESLQRLGPRGAAVRWFLTPAGAAVLNRQLRAQLPGSTWQLVAADSTQTEAQAYILRK